MSVCMGRRKPALLLYMNIRPIFADPRQEFDPFNTNL